MNSDLHKITDHAVDAWRDLTSTQTSRTGHVAARVVAARDNNVDDKVLALQLSLNSLKNNPENPVTFTAREMATIAKLFKANKTRSAFTKQQAGALIRGQRDDDAEGVPTPVNP